MANNWEKWQESNVKGIFGSSAKKDKYKLAKRMLEAGKNDYSMLEGLSVFADMERTREILADEDEWGVTKHLMLVIICDNSDPSDFEIMFDYINRWRKYSASKNNISADLFKVAEKKFSTYLEEDATAIMHLLSEFEKCFTSLALGDYDLEMELKSDCDDYWPFVVDYLGELEGFDYLSRKMEEIRHKEVSDRWFNIMRKHEWKDAEVRSLLLGKVRTMTEILEKSDKDWDVGGFGMEYVLYGSICALENFPDEEAVFTALDSLKRLSSTSFIAGFLGTHFHISHRPLKSLLDESSGEKKSNGVGSIVDKIADVLMRVPRYSTKFPRPRDSDYSDEAKSLFRDVALSCSEEKFERLLAHWSNSFFKGSEANEVVEIVAIKLGSGANGSSIEESVEIIRGSGIEFSFLIRALEEMGNGPTPKKIIELLSSSYKNIESILEICTSPIKKASPESDMGHNGSKARGREPPRVEQLLGYPEEYSEGVTKIAEIMKENDHFKSKYSNGVFAFFAEQYPRSIEKKVVILEAIARYDKRLPNFSVGGRTVSPLKEALIGDLGDWSSQCRMVKFSLARASRHLLHDESVSSTILSALRYEMGEDNDRYITSLLGEVLACSPQKEDLSYLDSLLSSVNPKEGLLWAISMADNYTCEFTENLEKMLVRGLDLNSWTTRKTLGILSEKDCSEETIRKIESLIGNDKVHGYLKCCCPLVISRSRSEMVNPFPALISMFRLGRMKEEVGKPLQQINSHREMISLLDYNHGIPGFVTSFATKGSLVMPADFTKSLIFALSSHAKDDLLSDLDDKDELVRFGCAATLTTYYTNMAKREDVFRVLEEMSRKGVLGDYGIEDDR